ncbi:SAP domain-containing protein [Cohaesibacter gelatinilyticus]|uniref:Uncharacterized protein n=1 Tax=Cohaesibacter gelatinilyticus TaxID=372072 RepID=A0A285N9S6_9HYPH|nr:SAP domain-containing protein [Cohaesibacter gelatinilyticus]SNZ06254.1 hypothetical protein SAMN06265368_0358 [Cohaesibacter gelatinilyticus]
MAEKKLRIDMSVAEFDAGYFYATDMKAFAREIGISVGNFRKSELEDLIRDFLATGKVPSRKPVLPRKPGAERDELAVNVTVTNYVGDKKTKQFLLELVAKKEADLKNKSGQWYWLNDWRRLRQESDRTFTYQDLADHLHSLMTTKGRLPQIPSARMNNFITDFYSDPQNSDIPRADVLKAWEWLKVKSGPKTYQKYKRLRSEES